MKLQSETNEIEIMTKKINDFISKYNQESEHILNTVYEFNKDNDDSEFITLRTPNWFSKYIFWDKFSKYIYYIFVQK